MTISPAVLFYTSDFLTGTALLDDDQIGKYIKLLCIQHQKFPNRLTNKDMLKICNSYDEDIFSKFIKDNEGRYYNKRMETEIIKRQNYCKSRSDNRSRKNKEEKKSNTYDKTYDLHMENENDNIKYNIIVEKFNSICKSFPKVQKITNSRKNKIKIRFDDIGGYKGFENLFNKIENTPFLKGDNKSNWIANFDWLIENDKNYIKVLEGNYDKKEEWKSNETRSNYNKI